MSIESAKRGNAVKAKQLGINYAQASNRLARLMLFSLLVKHRENVCHRCGGVIASIGELSLDHKQAWLHVDVGLFWDTDNVAFSHRCCNSSHRRTGANRVPGGCNSKEHRRKKSAEWYAANRERAIARKRELYRLRQQESS